MGVFGFVKSGLQVERTGNDVRITFAAAASAGSAAVDAADVDMISQVQPQLVP